MDLRESSCGRRLDDPTLVHLAGNQSQLVHNGHKSLLFSYYIEKNCSAWYRIVFYSTV